ncbi:heat shock 70 kDa protein 15-like isoform X2 [Iris pallida]|uniref:Heat shock 70 kDa protein 15-like isoform X2 n=1 Tax=Iris pallida TaxID=29817 RepID=A0AAX6ET61_IRIPA|nr:heat shock 70 kDa protein 15-like isoform X2 [Iris pallida]
MGAALNNCSPRRGALPNGGGCVTRRSSQGKIMCWSYDGRDGEAGESRPRCPASHNRAPTIWQGGEHWRSLVWGLWWCLLKFGEDEGRAEIGCFVGLVCIKCEHKILLCTGNE